ncbi:MAG: hypothetical protein OEM26_08125 [Saprospiraceae bacterium]|nr:hypothetical protein [Saprospiraceae bacterium]
MKILSIIKSVFCFFLIVASYQMSVAQFDAGADFVSRYLWRGQLLASGSALQPWVSYSKGSDNTSFEIGAWGSYGLSNGNDGTEADLYVSLTTGPVTFTLTDYFFPSDNPFAEDAASDGYFKYGDATGHVFEIGGSFDGTDEIPVSFGIYYNFAGADDDNSIYTKLALAASENIEVYLEGGNGWYSLEDDGEEDKFALVSLGLTYSKEIQISEKFSLPVFGTFAMNPNLDKPFIVFGISL